MGQQETEYFEKTEALLRQYIGDRMLLIKFKASEQSAKLATFFFVGTIVFMLAFFLLLFIGIMAGYYFSELTGSLFYGFGIITIFYLLLLVTILMIRKKHLEPYLTNMIIRKLFDKSTDHESVAEDQSHRPAGN